MLTSKTFAIPRVVSLPAQTDLVGADRVGQTTAGFAIICAAASI